MISITGALTARNVPVDSSVDNPGRALLHRAVKWRNQLLALGCLVLFAVLGILYFRNWVVQKPFAIILFVGEGLTTQRLAATRVYVGGADTPLAIDAFASSARLRNYSADFAVPDAAAAASAIATGVKVRNGAVSINDSGTALRTILELAHEQGRATGIVSDGELTNPALAPFYAHSADAKSAAQFANRLVHHTHIDVALGGGGARFENKGDLRRQDARVVRTRARLEEITAGNRLLGIFADGDLAFTDELAARAEQPSLGDMTRRAIELLEVNRGGYMLVVDAHLMAVAARQNLGERTLRETAELDNAVKTAREYAGARSTVIVAGDTGIGGMSVNGFPFRHDSGVSILGLNSAGQPWVTWATGPNGRSENATAAPTPPSEPAALQTAAALNTIDDPVAAGAGLGLQKLHGVIENTELFSILRDAL